jgi:hypothetical protein
VDNVIWFPQPGPQTAFCQRTEFEGLFGGSKGPGKTDALLMEGLRQISNPRYHAAIFRRTYPNLQEIKDRAAVLFPRLGAKWKGDEHRWVFPSGARYDLRHCQDEQAKVNYQGAEFHYLAFDQVEEFTKTMYEYLVMQVRTSDPTIRTYVRSSANPGGIGHLWVKARWIDGKEPYKSYRQEFKLPDGTVVPITSFFIPATIYDNPILLKANPNYLAQLMNLPDDLRRAMLEGDWSVFAGQVFSEWRDATHICAPVQPPTESLKFMSLDWGYAKPYAVGWYFLDADERMVKYRELYGCKEPDVGVMTAPDDVGREILRLEKDDGEIRYRVADPSLWAKTGHEGPTIAESFANVGVYLQKADNDRLQGLMEVHRRFKVWPDGRPGLVICRNCVHTIRTVPALPYDPARVEDVNTEAEDHAYDETRYACMSRPLPGGDGFLPGAEKRKKRDFDKDDEDDEDAPARRRFFQ